MHTRVRIWRSVLAAAGLVVIVWAAHFFASASRPARASAGGHASPGELVNDPGVRPAVAPQSAPAVGAASRVIASDRDVVDLLGLSPAKLVQLDELIIRTRDLVMVRFFDHASTTRIDEGAVAISVQVPKDVVQELRGKFYEELKQIMGDDLEDYLIAQNATRLEAKFEFFGEFPIVYEVEAREGSLADATSLRMKSNVARNSGVSFAVGEYDADGLRERYGPIAALALGQERK
jgi:hypothetical protein